MTSFLRRCIRSLCVKGKQCSLINQSAIMSIRLLIRMICFLTILPFVLSSSSCQFLCLNQTDAQPKSPPVYIDDTIHDQLLFFRINCLGNESLIYANVNVSIDNPKAIEIKNTLPFNVSFANQSQNLTFYLTLHGKLLGYSELSLHVEYFDQNQSRVNWTNDLRVDMAVKRQSTVLDTIFTVVVIVLVCIGTFLIGCRLVKQNLYANIRRPIPILIGLFSQFLCLPLVSIEVK